MFGTLEEDIVGCALCQNAEREVDVLLQIFESDDVGSVTGTTGDS